MFCTIVVGLSTAVFVALTIWFVSRIRKIIREEKEWDRDQLVRNKQRTKDNATLHAKFKYGDRFWYMGQKLLVTEVVNNFGIKCDYLDTCGVLHSVSFNLTASLRIEVTPW